MNLHEYQSKNAFEQFQIPLPRRMLINDLNQIDSVIQNFSSEKIVAKVQIHAGGRGKVGGVALIAREKQAVRDFVQKFLGQYVQTHQTSHTGQLVSSILFEAPIEIQKELYLSCLIDRSSQSLVVLASPHGGMNIEDIPEDEKKMFACPISLLSGPFMSHAFDIVQIGFELDHSYVPEFYALLKNVFNAFCALDASLIEINPFVLMKNGHFCALDAKVTIDDNALFRQKDFVQSYDFSQDDEREIHARKYELSYISLDGSIGCMVNGAGLAMATMDLIQYAGGNPANFLDVGGGATEERVSAAFEIILKDPKVKVIFVNIFGGIVRCDLIASGILNAAQKLPNLCPIVVRLQGNQADQGAQLLASSGLDIHPENDFLRAAQLAVSLSSR